MRHVILLAGMACLAAPSLHAQSATHMCVQESFEVICRVQATPIPQVGDPLYVVSASIVRTVPGTSVSVITRATDCGTRKEQRNLAGMGAQGSGQVAQFNWPVALQDTRRRCVEIQMTACRRADGGAVGCGAVVSWRESRVSVRW